jgi:hypothetical protein
MIFCSVEHWWVEKGKLVGVVPLGTIGDCGYLKKMFTIYGK